MKIKVKDKIRVIAGKDSGKVAEVIRVLPEKSAVVVSGVNVVKKAVKASKKNQQGGIIEIEKPFSVSNVALVCPNCQKPTRVGYAVTKSGSKDRICKKCGKVVKE